MGFTLHIAGLSAFPTLPPVTGSSGDNVVIIELNGKLSKEAFEIDRRPAWLPFKVKAKDFRNAIRKEET